jgi:hypothetical protein
MVTRASNLELGGGDPSSNQNSTDLGRSAEEDVLTNGKYIMDSGAKDLSKKVGEHKRCA